MQCVVFASSQPPNNRRLGLARYGSSLDPPGQLGHSCRLWGIACDPTIIWTQFVTDFLSAKRALAEIESIIDGAEARLIMVSPYQKISDTFWSRIAGAARRGFPITFVYGKSEMDTHQLRRLQELPNMSVYYSPSLHAKCYLNEKAMVITSLNLHSASEQNWEMGVLLTPSEKAYRDAVDEVHRIIDGAQARGAVPRSGVPQKPSQSHRSGGSCIRCRTAIELNQERPFCLDCFLVWSQWDNWDYSENWCHECGEAGRTSRAEPLCRKCSATRSSFRRVLR